MTRRETTRVDRRETGSGEPARFGGWSDYGEWADHDFRERRPGDEPGASGQRQVAVESITLDFPITVLDEREADARLACRISTPSGGVVDQGDLTLDLEDASTLVRPYVRSGGQAEDDHHLGFETLIETTQPYATLPLRDMSEDQRQIFRSCAAPRSVAEIAVAIDAPLGLVKAIISSALDKGYLRVRSSESPTDGGLPSMALLRRVHAGLSRL